MNQRRMIRETEFVLDFQQNGGEPPPLQPREKTGEVIEPPHRPLEINVIDEQGHKVGRMRDYSLAPAATSCSARSVFFDFLAIANGVPLWHFASRSGLCFNSQLNISGLLCCTAR